MVQPGLKQLVQAERRPRSESSKVDLFTRGAFVATNALAGRNLRQGIVYLMSTERRGEES
jgi:hypothetical protein